MEQAHSCQDSRMMNYWAYSSEESVSVLLYRIHKDPRLVNAGLVER